MDDPLRPTARANSAAHPGAPGAQPLTRVNPARTPTPSAVPEWMGVTGKPDRSNRHLRSLPQGGAEPAPLRPRPGITRVPSPLARLLADADVRIDGGRPWDLRVHDPRLFRRVMHHGSLGLGESYLDGDWDCDALDEMVNRLLRQEDRLREAHRWALPVLALRDGLRHWHHRLVNRQTRRRAYAVGEHHYDASNALFERMLDPLMQYSCGYWGRADTLEAAQRDKVALVAAKLQLEPGQRVLDIGCGWGGLAATLAQRHGVQVTGLTVSREQQAWAQLRAEDLPVTIELADWREHEPARPYDRIVSVGMFEHVGPHNHRAFLQRVRRWLAPQGLFMLHTIGLHRTTATTDAWIDRHIFPNGKLPSARELARAAEDVFLIEDWQNFGPDYDRTLMAWHERLERAWPALAAAEPERHTLRQRRMWRYYLMSCAGFFRSRQGQLWQLVLAGPERGGAYRSVRFDTVAPDDSRLSD